MEMVRHEAVRQTPNRNALLSFVENPEERPVVTRSIEQLQSANTSIHDVKDDATHSDSLAIRHG
jgi:Fe2+ or Zn2+ uptake regulation protein